MEINRVRRKVIPRVRITAPKRAIEWANLGYCQFIPEDHSVQEACQETRVAFVATIVPESQDHIETPRKSYCGPIKGSVVPRHATHNREDQSARASSEMLGKPGNFALERRRLCKVKSARRLSKIICNGAKLRTLASNLALSWNRLHCRRAVYFAQRIII